MNCGCGGLIIPKDGYLVCTGCGEVHDRDWILSLTPQVNSLSSGAHDAKTFAETKTSQPTDSGSAQLSSQRINKIQNRRKWVAKQHGRVFHYFHDFYHGAQLLGIEPYIAQRAFAFAEQHQTIPVAAPYILATALLAVVRQHHMPITIQQIASMETWRRTPAEFRRGWFHALVDSPRLAQLLRGNGNDYRKFIPAAVECALKRVHAEGDHFRERLTQEALRLKTVSGARSPPVLAASMVYAAARFLNVKGIPQDTWSEIGVCAYSVRMHWHDLKKVNGR